MKKPLPGQQNYFEAFIKAAQYFAGLTAQQDIWRETGKVLVNFFGAEVGALEGRRANAEAARHRWAFSERYSSRTDLKAEAGEAIAEVLESGFLSARIIFTPDPLSIACFPITQKNQVAAAMVVGHAMPKPLPRKLLNVYLALAGLVGTTVERLASERELWRHRQQLQEKIAELRQAEEAQGRSERRMTILNRIANVFLTIPDKEIYMEVLAVVLQVMKSQFGVFGFIETNGDLVIPSLTREIWNKCQVADKSYVFPQNTWGTSLWGRAIREKRALFSNGPFRTPEGHVPIDCFLTAPIIFGNETIGLLSVANKESHYSEEDRKLLEGIAGYISPILNARLQRDQKEQERGRTEQALSESEALFRTSFENATVGICLMGIDGRFLNVNWKLCEVLGYTKVELNQIHFYDITYGEDKDIGASFVKRALAGEIDHTDFEKRYVNKNGQIIWAHVSSAIIRTLAGEPQYFITHIQDITDRKAAEEALRQLNLELDRRVLERTAELEAANKELDAFSYSVSHDLRAPLRHIDGFLELLQKNAGAALDEQSRHYMDAISGSANKMGVLIDDLLSFSRMGRHAMSFQKVALEELVRDIQCEFEPDTAGRNLDWRIGDLPPVNGDAATLRIVLVNLISNALKFTRSRQQARIEIGSLPGQAKEVVIYVRDNGVGFDMAYADKLFGVFQRLHRAEEFEGTGIGLATVRRIVARHGGRTWAEGKADQGATFYFSLP